MYICIFHFVLVDNVTQWAFKLRISVDWLYCPLLTQCSRSHDQCLSQCILTHDWVFLYLELFWSRLQLYMFFLLSNISEVPTSHPQPVAAYCKGDKVSLQMSQQILLFFEDQTRRRPASITSDNPAEPLKLQNPNIFCHYQNNKKSLPGLWEAGQGDRSLLRWRQLEFFTSYLSDSYGAQHFTCWLTVTGNHRFSN